MPYYVTDTHGALGIGEVLWASGHEPLLYYRDALWSAPNAVAEGLRAVATTAREGSQTPDAQDQDWWERAYTTAVLESELADMPPELADAIRNGLADLTSDECNDDDTKRDGGNGR
jgi:hypothetical protein